MNRIIVRIAQRFVESCHLNPQKDVAILRGLFRAKDWRGDLRQYIPNLGPDMETQIQDVVTQYADVIGMESVS